MSPLIFIIIIYLFIYFTFFAIYAGISKKAGSELKSFLESIYLFVI